MLWSWNQWVQVLKDGWFFYLITIGVFGFGLLREKSTLDEINKEFNALRKNFKSLEDKRRMV
jgi:hypothetical protein